MGDNGMVKSGKGIRSALRLGAALLAGAAVLLCARLRFHVPRLLGYALFLGALIWSRYDSIVNLTSGMTDVLLRDVLVAAGCLALFLSLNQATSARPTAG